MIYEQVLAEYHQLNQQIASIQAQLTHFPKENIFCSRNGTRYKWYQSDGHNQSYIPKSNRTLAQTLAQKKYLSSQLDDLLQEKTAIEFYLRHHISSSKASQLLADASPYRELLTDIFTPTSQLLVDWMNAPFESNPQHLEQLTHKTASGHRVRSKSETLIDMILYLNKIPFRYECSLHLGDTVLYPDFTIRHPKTGDFYYWEHFGLMDDPYYSKNVFSKLQLYNSFGIIPSVHLITTYETAKFPLSTQSIEKIVEYYFL